MPSFQLTVAVRASFLNLTVYKQDAVAAGAPFNQLRWMCLMAAEYVKRQVQSDSRLSLALLALDLQFETSVCCMLFVLSSVAFAEASLLPSRDSMSTRWVTPFSPASKRSGLVLLLDGVLIVAMFWILLAFEESSLSSGALTEDTQCSMRVVHKTIGHR